ncbi:hypothetical protein ILUMI_26785 [Ignelater luminosus]|uniref:Major facilitator superfamily (MFS) profile domain-containing protein n=1 Tax=Ignelater luminosus TaxID=2038154 RepID=A0A8K0FVV0_IGNLU|nr:hypothetical protein ILUMI_26785 [Ignelater luminosus]
MPESPYYLLMKGREDEVSKALTLLRWRNNVEKELLTLKADMAKQIPECGTLKALIMHLLLSIPQLVAANLTSLEEASYLTVIPTISMTITAPLFSTLIDAIGRKNCLLLVAVPQFIAWILTALAENIWIYYLATFFSGIGNAASYTIIPVYVCEIAEPTVRGTWGAYNDIKTAALICGCLPIIQILLFFYVPESPYYLLMKGRDDEASKTLTILRWRTNVEKEVLTLKEDVARQISESGTMKDLFSIISNRKALIMCVGMRIAQQFSGLSAFEMHTQYLFQQAGGDVSHEISAITVSGTLALSVSLSAFAVERFGRRPLMLFSSLGCALILTVETVYFSINIFTRVDVSNFGWLPLVGMLAYMVVCATGLGILPTLISGEVFSASIKSKAGDLGSVHYSEAMLQLLNSKNIEFVKKRAIRPTVSELRPIERYWVITKRYLRQNDQEAKTVQEFKQMWNAASRKISKNHVRRLMIQGKSKMGFLVDVPKAGFGNTNDSNTGRRFFHDPNLSAEITGVEVILEAISSGFKIDTKKFDTYCMETANVYVKLYSWQPMTPTLYKILMHDSLVIEKALLPIGQLSDFPLTHMRYAPRKTTKPFFKETLEMLLSDEPTQSMVDVFDEEESIIETEESLDEEPWLSTSG